VVLALVVIYGGVQLRQEYQAAKAREAALRAVRISPAPAPPFFPLANDAPVLPSGYKDVAMKNLFHPSRDPNVAVDPPPAPPPPPPMPELPRFHGQMNLGDGPMALLVEKPGMPEKAIKPGETIGQFKLVDVNTNEITFAWTLNGELARRSLREMADNTAPAAAAPDARSSQAASAPPPPVVKSNIGAGEITGFGFKE
ncbi:MAG: hypothetical protein NTW28_12790, partial [Candidatus Solibacter sp.]|nr:hypothetical protein [Candidatus Solibacter sp.]